MEEALESRQAEVRTQNDDAEPCEKKKGAAHRRPRVRVVSSRFMSPVAPASSSSSSSTSLDCPGSMKCPIPRRAPPPSSCSSSSSSSSLGINLRGSQSALRRRAGNSCPSTDDDEGDDTDDDCASLDSTPIKPEGERSVISRPLRPAINQQFNFHPSPFASGLQQGKRRGAKQSKEIVELTENVDPLDGNGKVMNTMILKRSTVGRTPKTTFMSNNLLRPNPHGGVVSSASSTAAARLVQSNGLVPGKNDAIGCGLNAETVRGQPNANCTRSSDPISSQAIICDSPPLPVHGSNAGKGRAMHGCRSSMPESDLFPTMSRKTIVEMSRSSSGDPFGDQYHKSVAPLCSRSLNSTLLSCQQSIFADPSKSVCKSVTASKCYPSPTKTSSTYLPPHPSNAKNVASVMKPAVEPMKRGKKLYGHQEDAHLLRLLYNRHLQWRFTNAKAEAAMHAQTTSAERSLHCLWAKISEMQQSVSSKRAEIERLKASRRIRCILDGQMQHLEAWSDLREEYLASLSEATKALQDATVRLPIDGDVKVDCKAIQQAVSVGVDNLQAISCYLENFMPMVEAASSNASALASIVNREKAMVEDCEALLSMAHALQIQECSLRSNLVQLGNRRSHSGQPSGINNSISFTQL